MSLRPFFYSIILALFFLFPPDAGAKNTNPKHVKAKADRAVAVYKEGVIEGRDVSGMLPKLQRVKELGDAGKMGQADALLDEILADFAALEKPTSGHSRQTVFTKNKLVQIIGYDSDVMEAFLSRDGKYLFFNSESHDVGDKNIYYATKIDAYTFQFLGQVGNVNTSAVDGVPTMDEGGNFYYLSTHAYGPGNLVSIFSGKFEDGVVKNVRPVSGISLNQPGWLNMDTEISADGHTLYATQTWFGDGSPPTKSHFFYARKIDDRFIPQDDSPKIFKHINKDKVVYGATISKDELEILYTRMVRKNKAIKVESLRAARKDRNSPFGRPKIIKSITGFAEAPAFSHDGQLIYYHKKTSDGVFRLYALHRNELTRLNLPISPGLVQ